MSTETTPPPWEAAATEIANTPFLKNAEHRRPSWREIIRRACLSHAAAITRERDEARAQVAQLQNELKRFKMHGVPADPAQMVEDLKIVEWNKELRAENAALRAQVERMRTALESVIGRLESSSWGQAGTFRISRVQFGDGDLTMLKESLAPTLPPDAGTEAKGTE